MKGQSPNIAICAIELGPGKGHRVQLLPDGKFRALDGRPVDAPYFQMNAAIAADLIEKLSQRKNQIVIDYEHQTLLADENGQPAPAAGWFKTIEYIEGQGLFAVDVEWTDKARQMIADSEYKYLSLVFPYNKEGVPLDILHAALTNSPAIDGMAELQLMAAKHFSSTQQTEDHTMNEELLKLLGLDDTATEEQFIAACKAALEKANQLQTEATATAETVAALKADLAKAQETSKPDPAKFVSVEVVEDLKKDLATLKANQDGKEVDQLVVDALEAGKLLPAQEAWARELGKKDIASLKAYIDNAQVIVPLRQRQTRDKDMNKNGEVTLTESEIAICKNMGISQDDFIKTRKQELEASA